ncbi:MFS transporter [Apilactobacillus timberlakei]|uniref:multidrug efflux MFS transporter n=1 Tax=Apilactobacillus timberlakei TaxID=2008380 RepID=UPI00112A6684|nr:MFS transporter [Apilactobacillus timberlakei]TPR20460.1 MFS transporter [Apilactobacillus timberlakei]TPR22504.1 MFS transporter [Apilactobacillus timberlakei]TPR23356.1 MFS transporter [Apilactobacillus timberlakei]
MIVTLGSKTVNWKQNLNVLWFGTFVAGIGFSCISPFIALFIGQLGHYNATETSIYSGLAFAAPFVVKMIVSPLWGYLADKYGRKPMLLRASFGMAVVIGCMSLVTSAWQLIILRLLQGVFSGFISNANALVAAETPKNKIGHASGKLSTGNVSGTLVGPMVGGLIADLFGYRYTFLITGIAMLIAFFLSVFFVHENFTPVVHEKGVKQPHFLSGIPTAQILFGMFLTTLFIQATNNSISPILSLYVKQLDPNSTNIALVAGIIQALNGVAMISIAPFFGKLGDRIGSHQILKFGILFSILIFFLTSFVQNIWQLGVTRFLIGISDAALLPTVQAMLAKYSPKERISQVFSWNQSFQAAGNVSGPMIGSAVVLIGGYRGVFIATTVLAAINLFLVRKNLKSIKNDGD